MKIVRNIIIVIVLICLILGGAFYLFSPNYKKDENAGKNNLVINYTNVTSSMKGKVIVDGEDVYISKEDIENYYDRYIHYDEKHDYVIVTKENKTVCFDIGNGTMDVNGETRPAKVKKQDGKVYVPITKLEDIYNIKVYQNGNIIVVDSLDRKLEYATLTKKSKLKYKRTSFSRTIEKLNSGSKVYIVPNQNNVKGYTYVRTASGNLGYIKDTVLSKVQTEREATVKAEQEKKKVSLVWDYFEYSAPKTSNLKSNDAINVVSPSFLYLDGSQVKSRVDSSGLEYIRWAKNNNYEVWAMISNNNFTEEKMNNFSEWINDYEKRKSVINQICNYAKQYNFDGINIDFENIYLKDKNALSRFIIELKPALEDIDVTLSVDVTEPDGSDNWSLCFNRNVIGDVADYIVFMAYDQVGKESSKAGPTAACYWVEKNINKFINQEEVPAEKIILGVPFYTVLWKEQDGVASGTAIAQKNIKIPAGVETTWLEDSKQKFMEYTQGNYTYKMWIEDTEATSQKLDYVKNYNLAGAAFWQRGFEDERVWSTVKEKVID